MNAGPTAEEKIRSLLDEMRYPAPSPPAGLAGPPTGGMRTLTDEEIAYLEAQRRRRQYMEALGDKPAPY